MRRAALIVIGAAEYDGVLFVTAIMSSAWTDAVAGRGLVEKCTAGLISLSLSWGLVSVLSACSRDRRPVERRLAVTQWDTAWQTSPGLMDSVLQGPTAMTVSGDVLFVIDESRSHVVGLDARTGTHLWQAGRRGQGPNEIAVPVGIYPDGQGGVGVLDVGNRRIVKVDARGQIRGIIPIGQVGTEPNQVCRLGGDTFLFADVYSPRLVATDTAGVSLTSLAPIWGDLATVNMWSRQVFMRGDGSGMRCVVALFTGRGFALLRGSAPPLVSDYIEHFDVFGVGDRRKEKEVEFSAALDAEFVADTLYVLFAGKTDDLGRLVDRYDGTTGEYRDTYRLPVRASEFAVGVDLIYARVLNDSSGATIIAVRPRE